MKLFVFTLLLSLLGLTYGQVNPAPANNFVDNFQAQFRFTRQDTMGNDLIVGAINGDFWYDANANSNRGAFRFEYNVPFPGPTNISTPVDIRRIIQIDDYLDPRTPIGQPPLGGISYLYCGSVCESEQLSGSFPPFYPIGTATPVGGSFTNFFGRTCNNFALATAHAQSTPEVTRIAWESNGNGASPCQVDVERGGSQRTFYDFDVNGSLQPGTVGPVPATTPLFEALDSWGCPEPICNAVANLHMSFDESGSIDDTEFGQQQQFARDLGMAFSFGDTGIVVGVSFFSQSGRRAPPTQTLQQTFNSYSTVVSAPRQARGTTCIPCGLDFAIEDFVDNGQDSYTRNGLMSRIGFPEIVFLFTDGANNVASGNNLARVGLNLPTNQNEGNSLADRSDRLNNVYGVTTVAIAVGNGVDMGDLQTYTGGITSNILLVPDFNSLDQSFIDALIGLSCALGAPDRCGPSCLGFCGCLQTCICPPDCDDGEPCTIDLCTGPQAAGGGCFYQPNDCDDGTPCTDDICIFGVGCDNAMNGCELAICEICNDMDPCTIDGCMVDGNGDGVCTYTRVDEAAFCDDNNMCTQDVCVPFQGCQYVDMSGQVCDDNNVCTTDTCTSATCVYSPRDCAMESPFDILVGDCQVASCSIEGIPGNATTPPRSPGCFLAPFDGAQIDQCGVCNGDGSTCAGSIGSGAAAGIGIGGLIAIIAVLAILALAGVFAGKKGFDYYQNNTGDLDSGNTNPIHEKNPHQGQNQMYSEN